MRRQAAEGVVFVCSEEARVREGRVGGEKWVVVEFSLVRGRVFVLV